MLLQQKTLQTAKLHHSCYMAFLKELALAYLTGPFYELPDDALQQKLFFMGHPWGFFVAMSSLLMCHHSGLSEMTGEAVFNDTVLIISFLWTALFGL